MSVDLRTRSDADAVPVDPRSFFREQLPQALALSRERLAPGAERLRLRPLCVEVAGDSHTLSRRGDAFDVRAGAAADAARVRLAAESFTALVHDQATPVTFFTGGTLDMPAGGLPDLLDWWLVLRGALDERPLHVPGEVRFRERDGAPLDLRRSFRWDDPLEELSHFLHEAGFLHLAGVFGEDEMGAISEEMDRAAPSYRDGDGRSWWVTVSGDARRLVRMQSFDEHSRGAAALLRDERFLRIGSIPGDGHVHTGMEGNRVEALVKPIGVVQGISDLPWHKDCSLGRHSYECCSLTTGISVTGADADSGQLRVIAGSHRALVWPALYDPARNDLPVVELPTRTGDVTVHLSCTLHSSQPPCTRERRVMYTSFRLPSVISDATRAARAKLRAVREGAYTTVSQDPSPVA